MLKQPKSKMELEEDLEVKRRYFRKKAGLELTGTTFDARHLDKFLVSEFGEYPQVGLAQLMTPERTQEINPNRQQVLTSSKPDMQATVQSNVRPLSSFISIGREYRKDVNYNTSDKPSSFLDKKYTRGSSTANSRRSKDSYICHQRLTKKEYNADKLNYTAIEEREVKNSSQRRKEMEDVKYNINKYQEYKRNHGLLNKRNRIVKSQWKNGILGVDSVTDKNTYFFKDRQKSLVERAHKSFLTGQLRIESN